MTSALHIAAGVFTLLAIGGLGYQLLSIFAALRYLRSRARPNSTVTPAISILKPLKGVDPEIYESFRSHCLQDYSGKVEIIFGVNDSSDHAAEAVARLRQEFPNCDISLYVCADVLGTNRKVSNLVQMAARAKYDHLVVNDSDIRVPRDYLRSVSANFADPQVGMVTALYRGVPHRGTWSKLEAVTIATDFAGGVLSAIVVEGGLHFALGSTLAIRKNVLEKIGGLQGLCDYLADDYELGNRTAMSGYRVALADVVVETFLPAYNFRGMFDHQLRWARTIRDKRKAGYLGVLFTFGLVWAALGAVFAGGAWWSLSLLLAVAVARFTGAFLLSARVLCDRVSVRNLWLVPLRDAIGVAVWLASFAGDTVNWRGERFRLHDGKLTHLS
jgi:ceramide glucosyltransferase